MTWALHRWIWELDGSLYVGAPPAGSLNRARLYVPARALWGAVSAELARLEGTDQPKYDAVGSEVREQTRFTYLYPAEHSEKGWHTWLPEYREGDGRVWLPDSGVRRAAGAETERRFRSRLLSTRPGTAIEPSNDAADEGSMRETECVQTRWRQNDGSVGSAVAMVGFVFTRDETIKRRLDRVKVLFLGGDSRYGLGRMRRITFDGAEQVFGLSVERGTQHPQVRTQRVLAHAEATTMRGDLECLAGWDYQKPGKVQKISDPLWMPGSEGTSDAAWSLVPDGTWKLEERPA